MNDDTPAALAAHDEAEWNRVYDEKHAIKKKILIPGSAVEVLLGVAENLQQPFSLTTLILACWEESQTHFGLIGAESDSACSRRVYACLAGARGLIATGYIKRVGRKYEVVKETT
jgi:hypothetical protein